VKQLRPRAVQGSGHYYLRTNSTTTNDVKTTSVLQFGGMDIHSFDPSITHPEDGGNRLRMDLDSRATLAALESIPKQKPLGRPLTPKYLAAPV
jgi:hypothetical protein